MEALLSACGQVGAVLVVDECFLPFTDGRSCQSRLRAYPNLMVLRAFTKLYAMAGLRLGYLMCADEDLAGRIGAWGQSWSVSAPAQVAGLAAVSEEGWPERTRRFLRMERPWMTDALGALGFFVYPSHSNFLLFQARPDLWDRAMARGVMLRPCSNFPGLDGSYFRIGLKKRVQNEMLLQVLKEIGG